MDESRFKCKDYATRKPSLFPRSMLLPLHHEEAKDKTRGERHLQYGDKHRHPCKLAKVIKFFYFPGDLCSPPKTTQHMKASAIVPTFLRRGTSENFFHPISTLRYKMYRSLGHRKQKNLYPLLLLTFYYSNKIFSIKLSNLVHDVKPKHLASLNIGKGQEQYIKA